MAVKDKFVNTQVTFTSGGIAGFWVGVTAGAVVGFLFVMLTLNWVQFDAGKRAATFKYEKILASLESCKE